MTTNEVSVSDCVRKFVAMPRLVYRALPIGLLILAAVFSLAATICCAAPLNLVLDTGFNTPLPSRVTANGAPTTVVSFNNPEATINGVTIRFQGFDTITPIVTDPFATGSTANGLVAKFIVLGDLTLNADQKIFGIGFQLAKLEVANNATLAAGSVIDVSGEGRASGAGGGAGGSASPSVMSGYSPASASVAIGGWGGGTAFANGINGTNGATSTGQQYRQNGSGAFVNPGTPEYAALFGSSAGGAGQIGSGNVGVGAGGVAGAYTSAYAAQGGGGPGGPAGQGSSQFGGPAPGVTGGTGGTGGGGPQGMSGANASAIQEQLNPTAVYLHGGNGGGAGATGGVGLPGGGGGGGGGGGASSDQFGPRSSGGTGGLGGIGGLGGQAGAGGVGGGGGGGIQLLVRGTLNYGGLTTAVGGNGSLGQAGGLGAAGTAGAAGQSTGNLGGNGGAGGAGGAGGQGGVGGNGMGGSGGVIQIVSSNLAYTGSTTTTGGLAGDGVTRSANGATYIHAYSGPSAGLSNSAYFGARAAGDNPYRSHSGTSTVGGAPVGKFANVPAIVGGAAPYGMLVGAPFGSVASGVQAFGGGAAPPPAPGHMRVGAVTRVNASWLAAQYGMSAFNGNNQELLLYSAFGGDLKNPALMSVDQSHSPLFGDVIPSGPVRLRAGNGYLNDPTLTSGAVAPTDMANLPNLSTFAMYASGTQNVTASFSPYGTPRTFSGTPTVGTLGSPGASTVFLEDNGFLYLGILGSSATTGRGTGAIVEEDASGEYGVGLAAFDVRAGGNASVHGYAQGIGNAGTQTSGEMKLRTLQPPPINLGEPGPLYVQSSQSFSQIDVGEEWNSAAVPLYTKNLPLGTRQRVADVIYAPDYDDNVRSISIPIDANIFGPSPQLAGAGTSGMEYIAPGAQVGSTSLGTFSLTNADILSPINSIWRSSIQQSPQLIRLSVLSMQLDDPSGAFSVSGLPSSFVLNGNQSQSINVGFHPTTPGMHEAHLTLLTDVNAEVGQAGDTLTITLRAIGLMENADFNMDGIIDGGDLLIWQRNFGTGTGLATGDANSDGLVNSADLDIWRQQFGSSPGPLTAVPEPTSLASLIGCIFLIGFRSGRRV
ncbi:MAG: hypothetical protein JNL18_02855 [Planctomycetaceae bacterium]|nr:hypothetical protein [Planctomycetaceae bacterium]